MFVTPKLDRDDCAEIRIIARDRRGTVPVVLVMPFTEENFLAIDGISISAIASLGRLTEHLPAALHEVDWLIRNKPGGESAAADPGDA